MARTQGEVETSRGRHYSGMSPEQRIQARRQALLGSSLQLFGTAGYAATSVKALCREAGLTERYFYESFRDREACLHSLYGELTHELRTVTVAAVAEAGEEVEEIARRGLSAFVGYLTDDPRRARVVLIEVVGVSPALEAVRHGVLSEFADVINRVLTGAAPDDAVQVRETLTGVALAGAVNHLLVDWLMGGRKQEPALLVDVCATLFSAAQERLASERTARM